MSVSLNTTSLPNVCSYPLCVNHDSANMKCSRCKSAIYCGQICQKADWPAHKKVCNVFIKAKEQTNTRVQESSNGSVDASFCIKNVKQALPNSSSTMIMEISRKVTIGKFSQEELDILGYTEKEVELINSIYKSRSKKDWLSKANLPCFDYALLEVKERGVREQIFIPIGNRSFKEVIDERLQRWGYEVKDSPEEGDFVIYCDQKNYTHMGVYLNNGFVKSKPGNACDHAIIHNIHEISHYYGNQVLFFRKNPQAIPVYREVGMIKLI